MKKEIIAGLFIFILLLTLGFVIADEPGPPYEVAQNQTGVETSSGTVTLYEGTLVAGNPTNYITLTEEVTVQTTAGPQVLQPGTKIDCDHEPGQPDPCAG